MGCHSQSHSANSFRASDLNRTGVRVAVRRIEIRLVALGRDMPTNPADPWPDRQHAVDQNLSSEATLSAG